MKRKFDYSYLCQMLANFCGIPIRCYIDNKQTCFYSTNDFIIDPIVLINEDINKIDKKIFCYINLNELYYGVINLDRLKIIVGPTFETITNSKIEELMDALNLDEGRNEFRRSINSIIKTSLESLCEILRLIYYVISNEKIANTDILISSKQQDQIISESKTNSSKIQEENIDNNEVHNTYLIENKILNYIEIGDVDGLTNWLSKAPSIKGGTIADAQIRQTKNIFITVVTLATRAAIIGGMSVNSALSLSDKYINHCEKLNTIIDITNYQYFVLLELTKKLNDLHVNQSDSKLVIDVSNYINEHINDNIKVNDISKALFISRSRLSTKFKKDCGITLNSYIDEKKINEAKRLLKYTNKQLIEISNELSYSSPSHFTNSFKRLTNLSPQEYRKQNK